MGNIFVHSNRRKLYRYAPFPWGEMSKGGFAIRHLGITTLLVLWSLPCLGRNFRFFEPLQPPRPIQIVVHRGQRNVAPENTRPALERCIEDGLEWIEVDIRRTSDGIHILSHSDTIIDADGKQWKVDKTPWSELQTLDVGTSFAPRYRKERLLTLDQCLFLARNRINLYLDAKDADPEQLAAEILAGKMESQVTVYAQPSWLLRLQSIVKGRIATMAKWRPGTEPAAWAADLGLAAVEIDAPQLTGEVAHAFHQAGIKIQTKNLGEWDRTNWWDHVMDAGADWIQTDLPEELYAHAFWRYHPHPAVQFSLHRGAGRYAPENTIPALQKALHLKADYLEIDVRASSDGHFFLLHDSRLDRTTNGKGLIRETTSTVLSQLDAGAWFGRPFQGITLIRLEEFLSHAGPTAQIYLDAKEIPAPALVDILHQKGAIKRTVVYASREYLLQLKTIQPDLRRMPPLRSEQDMAPLIEQLKPYAFDVAWKILSQSLIDRCHAAGVKVFSDALGSHENIQDYSQAVGWGIDLIQTDHPLRLFRALELQHYSKTPSKQSPRR